MEKIDITSKEYDYKKVYKDSFIDLDLDIIKPEPLIYMGVDFRGQRVPAMTKGEYSAFVGASKSKKSFLKSLTVASFIGGNTVKFTSHILTNRKKDNVILDIDTEQGKYYAHRTFNRVRRLVGGKYDKYKPFALRKLTPEERLNFIDDLLKEIGKNVDIVFIDGIADLVDDVNNLVLSNYVTSRLMKWTDLYNIHISVVLHKNFNSSKPTGHLGSAILKKAESIIFVNKIVNDQNEVTDKNFVRISSEYARGMQFEDFYLGVDENGLPYTLSEKDYMTNNIEPDKALF